MKMNPHEEYILDKMLTEARVMMMDGSPLELDPSQFSDCVTALVNRTREAEKDAARYRWLRDRAHTVTGVTPCAFVMKDGELMEDWNGQYGQLCMGALDAAVDEAISENQT